MKNALLVINTFFKHCNNKCKFTVNSSAAGRTINQKFYYSFEITAIENLNVIWKFPLAKYVNRKLNFDEHLFKEKTWNAKYCNVFFCVKYQKSLKTCLSSMNNNAYPILGCKIKHLSNFHIWSESILLFTSKCVTTPFF